MMCVQELLLSGSVATADIWYEPRMFTLCFSTDGRNVISKNCFPLVQWCQQKFNPFTATACKVSGLKRAHIHACKQYNWRSCNKSTFNTVHFDSSPFRCWMGVKHPVTYLPWWFQVWHFYWSFSEWRRGKHGSERVNMHELLLSGYVVTAEMRLKKQEVFLWLKSDGRNLISKKCCSLVVVRLSVVGGLFCTCGHWNKAIWNPQDTCRLVLLFPTINTTQKGKKLHKKNKTTIRRPQES